MKGRVGIVFLCIALVQPQLDGHMAVGRLQLRRFIGFDGSVQRDDLKNVTGCLVVLFNDVPSFAQRLGDGDAVLASSSERWYATSGDSNG